MWYTQHLMEYCYFDVPVFDSITMHVLKRESKIQTALACGLYNHDSAAASSFEDGQDTLPCLDALLAETGGYGRFGIYTGVILIGWRGCPCRGDARLNPFCHNRQTGFLAPSTSLPTECSYETITFRRLSFQVLNLLQRSHSIRGKVLLGNCFKPQHSSLWRYV
jgi:hypothetical protein